jgi:hypothetical protein
MATITAEQLVELLADALITHREDMHNSSNRPCSTCTKSKRALDAYGDWKAANS